MSSRWSGGAVMGLLARCQRFSAETLPRSSEDFPRSDASDRAVAHTPQRLGYLLSTRALLLFLGTRALPRWAVLATVAATGHDSSY